MKLTRVSAWHEGKWSKWLTLKEWTITIGKINSQEMEMEKQYAVDPLMIEDWSRPESSQQHSTKCEKKKQVYRRELVIEWCFEQI